MLMEISKKINYSIIEPVSTVIIFALLSLKKENTKISIYNNMIFLRGNSYLQGVLRWGWGENREEIFSIQYPIVLGINWILSKSNGKYKKLLLSSVNGIMKLSKCYEDDNQINLFLLQIARNMQELILKKSEGSKILEQVNKSQHNYFPSCINNDFINLLWENDINIIIHNLDLIYTVIEKFPNMKDEHIANCIKNINHILRNKNKLFSKKIKNIEIN